jgi:hypothetical protein
MARDFKVPGFGLNSDVPRRDFEDYRPYTWGFFPDQESEAAWSASFLCRKLHGGLARFVKDLTLQTTKRVFGLIHPRKDSARGPQMYDLSRLLKTYAKNECGLEFAFDEEIAGGGQGQAGTIMSKFKQNGVTTVVCYCVPVQSELTVSTMQNAAAGIGYSPEWYWDHASRMFRYVWNKRFGDPKQSSFGVNHHWRNPAFKQQVWYQSYLSQEPATKPNTRFNFDVYHLFLNLFQGIQGAGPNLTPESIERGMFTFNYLNRDNPFEPIGGYGPYDAQAISDYTFVDTAMGWWWDPTGIPPGGKAGDGCLRAMNEGTRYYAGEWPMGDADLFKPDAPCFQDDTQIENATDF